MDPGIHTDIPFDEYCWIPGLNGSVLEYGHPPSGSMLHLKAALDGQIEVKDSDDMRFGRLYHLRVLEPERYKSEALIAGKCSAVKKGDGQPCTNNGTLVKDRKWYCGTKGHAPDGAEAPADYVSEHDAAKIEAMASVLHNHECQRLLRYPGWSEAVIIWDLKLKGSKITHRMKSRLDRITIEAGIIIDLKKAQRGAVHEAAIVNQIWRRGYHRKAANYVDAAKAATGKDFEFVWLFQEDSPPYDVGLMRASPDVLAAGRFEYRQIISNLEYAQKKGEYSGTNQIPRRIESVLDLDCGGLPKWYLEQLRNVNTERSYATDVDNLWGGGEPGDGRGEVGETAGDARADQGERRGGGIY